MGTIEIRKIGITDLDTDAIVNAANDGLWAGGGVCGAIFKALYAIKTYGDSYPPHRVFFKDEATAIAAGFRPCGNCMKAHYKLWKEGKIIPGNLEETKKTSISCEPRRNI